MKADPTVVGRRAVQGRSCGGHAHNCCRRPSKSRRGWHSSLPAGASVRSWLGPFRVSDGVWVSIPAPPTLFCCAVSVCANLVDVQAFSRNRRESGRRAVSHAGWRSAQLQAPLTQCRDLQGGAVQPPQRLFRRICPSQRRLCSRGPSMLLRGGSYTRAGLVSRPGRHRNATVLERHRLD
jgi:hypothetical protein